MYKIGSQPDVFHIHKVLQEFAVFRLLLRQVKRYGSTLLLLRLLK